LPHIRPSGETSRLISRNSTCAGNLTVKWPTGRLGRNLVEKKKNKQEEEEEEKGGERRRER
jgi:hypothetical protein